MGKVTLAVLVAAIALAVYWFWWSDQGANSPITVQGTVSVSGIAALPGASGLPGTQKVSFTLQAVPNKLRASARLPGKNLSAIILLGKREIYVLNETKKTYAREEFDLVDKAQTKPLEEAQLTWPKEFKRTADWDYLGSSDQKWFCNKQTVSQLPKELAEISETPGAKAPAAALMQAMLKNVKEMWLTPQTRLGRRYFSMLNRLARIQHPGKAAPEKEKRPQFKYVNLDFFPIPMKAIVSSGPMQIEMNVSNLSRKKIPKDVFQVPSDYNKVSMKEVTQ